MHTGASMLGFVTSTLGLGNTTLEVMERRNNEQELMPQIKHHLQLAHHAIGNAHEVGLAEEEIAPIVFASNKLAETYNQALLGAGVDEGDRAWLPMVKFAFGKFADSLGRDLDDVRKELRQLYSALQLQALRSKGSPAGAQTADAPTADDAPTTDAPTTCAAVNGLQDRHLGDIGILMTGTVQCPCCNQRFESVEHCAIHHKFMHAEMKYDPKTGLHFSQNDFKEYYKSFYAGLDTVHLDELWDSVQVTANEESSTAAPDSDDSSVKDLFSNLQVDDTEVGPEMQFCLEIAAEGMQHNSEYCEMVTKSLGPMLEDPGIAGHLGSAVQLQCTVMFGMEAKVAEQTESLEHFGKLMTDMGAGEAVASKGAHCLLEADALGKELAEFVLGALHSTGDIDNMLVHLQQGISMFNMLRLEASKKTPSRNKLAKLSHLAYTNLKKAEMSDEFSKKMDDLRKAGIKLSKQARNAAHNLQEYVNEWKQLLEAKLEAKASEAEKLLKAAEGKAEKLRKASEENQFDKDKNRWSLWGGVGMVALSVIGVGIAAAAIAGTGGAALAPLTFMAAHAGLWGGLVVGGGLLVGEIMANKLENKRRSDAQSSQQAYEAAQAEVDKIMHDQCDMKMELENEVFKVNKVVERVEIIQKAYENLHVKVMHASSEAGLLTSHLKHLLKKPVPILDATEDISDLDLLCDLVKNVTEKQIQDVLHEIETVSDSNQRLRKLAEKTYTEYTGKSVRTLAAPLTTEKRVVSGGDGTKGDTAASADCCTAAELPEP